MVLFVISMIVGATDGIDAITDGLSELSSEG